MQDGNIIYSSQWVYYTFALIPAVLDVGFKLAVVWFLGKTAWLISREICSAVTDCARLKFFVNHREEQ